MALGTEDLILLLVSLAGLALLGAAIAALLGPVVAASGGGHETAEAAARRRVRGLDWVSGRLGISSTNCSLITYVIR